MRRSVPNESRPIRRDLLKMLQILVVGVLFIAFVGPVSEFLGNFAAERFKESVPDLPGPTTTAASEATTTTVALVDAPPTFTMACPTAGQGWTATMIATQYVQDPVGYHTWYRITGDGIWVDAGLFRSGLDGPAPLRGIASGVQVELRYDRQNTIDPEKSEGYASFTTGAAC